MVKQAVMTVQALVRIRLRDIVSAHRVLHLLRRSLALTCRALEVQGVRLRALRLAPGVSQARYLQHPVSRYKSMGYM